MKSETTRKVVFETEDIENLVRLYMRKKFPDEEVHEINIDDDLEIFVTCESKDGSEPGEE